MFKGPERSDGAPKPAAARGFMHDLVPLLTIGAMVMFILGAVKMFQIHSEAGDTIMEEFFHDLGLVSIGFAVLSAIIGVHVFGRK